MRRVLFQTLRVGVIWLISAAVVLVVSWFAPTLFDASVNMYFRLRGELPAPDNIVIVAIDDASIQRIGKYPWSRRITAECLDKISTGKPLAVGLDVIYAEETEPEDEARLTAAIAESKRVVLPAQLFEDASATASDQTEIRWLKPLPDFELYAAGIGHAHAAPGVDGTLRSIQLSKSDDRGNRLWAFGLEILRVADQIPAADFEEKPDVLRYGSYDIKLLPADAAAIEIPGASVVRSDEMLINYVGATNSFRYYSFADVINGDVAPEAFAGKIVLIGATSPTLGDSHITPFMNFTGGDGRMGGQAMPGVEVHANVINTIKNRLWLSFLPPFWDLSIALLIIFAATAIIKLLDGWRQIIALAVAFFLIFGGTLFSFDKYFLILPLPEMLAAFLSAVPLLLLDRSLVASRNLDVRLSMLAGIQKGFLLDEKVNPASDNKIAAIVPRNLEWKLRAVDDITSRLLSRMSFINRVLTGMTDGVIAADTTDQIVFVNECFERMFKTDAKNLLNCNLTEFFLKQGVFDAKTLRLVIDKVLAGESYEKEFVNPADEHNYFLRFSPVTASNEAVQDVFKSTEAAENSTVIGILVLLSDVTEQRELDRLKAETVQFVSHELRSPLTSIQGLSDVLIKFPVSLDESKEMLATIHSEAVRLNEIINRFLDIKRLESGVQDMQIAPVEINELVKNCVLSANPSAAEKEIKIEPVVNRRLPFIQADAQLLAQAIGNLLNNAVKYSPPSTVVKIETARFASELQIIVSDHGYGIPANRLERIFDKFYRLERDTASEIVGSGLGLSFVKEVAEKHGGRVTVESREGDGSIFILHLPN